MLSKEKIIQGVHQIAKFDWSRIIFPFSTYNKRKFGYSKISILLIFLDLLILVVPFSTIIVVLLVKFVLNDVE